MANAPASARDSVGRWLGVDAAELAASWGAPAVHALDRVDSTNAYARRLAAAGAAAGTVVIAEEQTAGRGTSGRTWASPPGLGVWLSVVTRPEAVRHPGVLPILAGLAAAAALDRFTAPATVGLKWPNDLVFDGRKLGGLLCEAAWNGAAAAHVVVGCGVNVLQDEGDFPPELQPLATSLRLVSGRSLDRHEVAGALASALVESFVGELSLPPVAVAAFAARDDLRGRRVTAREPVSGELIAEGIAAGIDLDGALRLEGPTCHPEEPFGYAQGRLRDEGPPSPPAATPQGTEVLGALTRPRDDGAGYIRITHATVRPTDQR